MSIERTRVPIMTDVIMYYDGPRIRPFNSYAPQPEAAFTGLLPHAKEFQFINRSNTQDQEATRQVTALNAKTTLVLPKTGYSHTGGGIGTVYKNTIDPKYARLKYGNDRPQFINYSLTK